MSFGDFLRRVVLGPEAERKPARSTFATSTLGIESGLPTHTQYLEWSGLYPISLSGAMSIPGVLQANTIIVDLGSQIELTEEKRIIDDDGTVRWERIPRPAPIIRRPNVDEPAEETMRSILGAMAGEGEAWMIPTSYDLAGRPSSIEVVERRHVRTVGDEITYRRTPRRLWRDIFHVPYYKLPGQRRGIGPIQAYALVLDGSMTVETWTRAYFSEGGQYSTRIHSRDELDPYDAAQLRADWMETRGGTISPAVTSGDLEVHQEAIEADKAQALDTRRWNLQSVASMYRLNPYLLAVAMSGSSITYQTLPDLAAEAIRLTIYPGYLRKIETVFSEMLPYGRRARFTLREFLRADEKTRMETAKTAIEAGVLTPDEVRADEGRRPLGVTHDATTL